MTRHNVELGDELMIKGYLFIVTEVKIEMNQPASLTTKQPIELIEFRRE